MAFNRFFTIVTVLFLVSWLFLRGTQAQVTFSRDWNPGKRNLDLDVHPGLKSANAICHLLINQLRQVVSCDSQRDDVEITGLPVFNGRR